MRFRNGICALFIFSLTSSALAERLHVAEMPHIPAEVIKPEVVPSVSSVLGASGRLIVSVGDQMPEMLGRVRTTLAW
jgi:hypothetical protein